MPPHNEQLTMQRVEARVRCFFTIRWVGDRGVGDRESRPTVDAVTLAVAGGLTMESIKGLFSGGGAFALYFLVSLAVLAMFVTLYSLMSAHREMTLIREGNKAAALSLGGAILGFVIPVGKAVAQSVSLVDLLVWAAIAFVAQVLAYALTAAVVPHLRAAIAEDHVAVAIGILNAASMTA
jgi:putative membrane protein